MTIRPFLVAAMCNASRKYSRNRRRSESLPETYDETPDPGSVRALEMWPDQLAARQAFARTTARCQLVLRLRYFEEYTIPEIADELGISKRYASKLVGECIRQAHRRYKEQTGRGSRL
jgi:RNA polymerase sigma factor (sigma-70 family)